MTTVTITSRYVCVYTVHSICMGVCNKLYVCMCIRLFIHHLLRIVLMALTYAYARFSCETYCFDG